MVRRTRNLLPSGLYRRFRNRTGSAHPRVFTPEVALADYTAGLELCKCTHHAPKITLSNVMLSPKHVKTY